MFTSTCNKNHSLLFLIAFCLYPFPAKAQTYNQVQSSVYQYSVKVGSKQAYLWVPPKCKQVKGVIISFANLLERNWLEDAIIRKTAEKNNLAIILLELDTTAITPDLKPTGRAAFLKMLNDLADESGYTEIANAPFIPIDHSVHGVFTWNLPRWLPERTIAAMPVKTLALLPQLDFSGIPICYIIGENDEWPPIKDGKPWSRDFIWPAIRQSAVKLRSANKNNLISVVTDAGGGHLDWSDKLSTFMALFIDKACQYRLPVHTPENQIPQLNLITPQQGWLTDTGGLTRDLHQPATYLKYRGDPTTAYWFFDKETALAASAFNGDRQLRKKQMLTFTQNGQQLAITKQGFVALPYIPEQDGITFSLKGDFLPTIPAGFINAGAQLGHAEGAIKFKVITGPAQQVSPGNFKVAFNRSSPGGDIWIQEEHPGDKIYVHAVQPAQIKLPLKLLAGKPQTINFPQIVNQSAHNKKITLSATTDTDLRVNYYVVSGPAIIQNDTLIFTEIPVKSLYPVKVTVTAYQWGRMVAPLYQSAMSVTQSFYLTK